MILYEIHCYAEIREGAGISSFIDVPYSGISSFIDVPYSGVRHRTRKGAAEELAKARKDGAPDTYICEVELKTWCG